MTTDNNFPFGRPGEIERFDVVGGTAVDRQTGHLDTFRHRFPAHRRLAMRTSLDMTMFTSQVALSCYIHLENIDAGSPERENATIDQAPDELIPVVGLWCSLHNSLSCQ